MRKSLRAITLGLLVSTMIFHGFISAPSWGTSNGYYSCSGGGTHAVANNIISRSSSNSFCLGSVSIPGDITYIDNSAFSANNATNTAGLSQINFEENSQVTGFGTRAFYLNVNLTSIRIPRLVTTIGDSALSRTGLNSVEFEPNSALRSIGVSAFEDSQSFTSITLPAQLDSIGGRAFTSSRALAKIYFLGPSPSTLGSLAFADIAPSAKFYVYAENLASFTNSGLWTGVDLQPGYRLTYFSTGSTSGSVPVEPIPMFRANESAQAAANSGNLTRQGYSFGGWNTRSDGSGTSYSPTNNLVFGSANVDLYPIWIPNSYTVTFDSGGGTSVANGTFTADGSIANSPGSPSKSGFTFSGWSTSDGGSAISFPYTPGVLSGITLYAKWTPVPSIETPAESIDTDLLARTVGSKEKYSVKALAKQVGVKVVSSKAALSINVSKSSKKICTKSGSKLKTLKAGTCVVTFTVQEPRPKKGKKPKATKTVKTLVVQ